MKKWLRRGWNDFSEGSLRDLIEVSDTIVNDTAKNDASRGSASCSLDSGTGFRGSVIYGDHENFLVSFSTRERLKFHAEDISISIRCFGSE